MVIRSYATPSEYGSAASSRRVHRTCLAHRRLPDHQNLQQTVHDPGRPLSASRRLLSSPQVRKI
jgi:hypothetical protein